MRESGELAGARTTEENREASFLINSDVDSLGSSNVNAPTCCIYIYWNSLQAGALAGAHRKISFTPARLTRLCRSSPFRK